MGKLAFAFLALLLLVAAGTVRAQTNAAAAIQDIKNSLKLPSLVDWSNPDQCSPWPHVYCSWGRVDAIQLGNVNFSGTVSPSIRNLTALRRFGATSTQIFLVVPPPGCAAASQQF